jgi:metal-responsive CopG/Arc/MetJ family transcriptional regulator
MRITLNYSLIELVDKIVKELKTTRYAFTRKALREAVNRCNINRLEEQHRRGYELHPVTKEESASGRKNRTGEMNEKRRNQVV